MGTFSLEIDDKITILQMLVCKAQLISDEILQGYFEHPDPQTVSSQLLFDYQRYSTFSEILFDYIIQIQEELSKLHELRSNLKEAKTA